jgi:hypothetical protein
MPKKFDFKGYTIITSLSHGILAPLKQKFDLLAEAGGKNPSNLPPGTGGIMTGLPEPGKAILVFDSMREALFDDNVPDADKAYRSIFGDKIMTEGQIYVRKVPGKQVSFRADTAKQGDITDMAERICRVFENIGIRLSQNEKQDLIQRMK